MIKTALEAHALSKKPSFNTDKWLKDIESKIDRCIENKKYTLRISGVSPLEFLLKDEDLRLHIFKELQEVGYRTYYFSGAYGRPRFILIDWSNICLSEKEQEILERKQIDKELREMTNSLTLIEK